MPRAVPSCSPPRNRQNDEQEAPDDRRNEEQLRLRKEGYEQSGGSLDRAQKTAVGGINSHFPAKENGPQCPCGVRTGAEPISGTAFGPGPKPTIMAILAMAAEQIAPRAMQAEASSARVACPRAGCSGSDVLGDSRLRVRVDAAHAQAVAAGAATQEVRRRRRWDGRACGWEAGRRARARSWR